MVIVLTMEVFCNVLGVSILCFGKQYTGLKVPTTINTICHCPSLISSRWAGARQKRSLSSHHPQPTHVKQLAHQCRIITLQSAGCSSPSWFPCLFRLFLFIFPSHCYGISHLRGWIIFSCAFIFILYLEYLLTYTKHLQIFSECIHKMFILA